VLCRGEAASRLSLEGPVGLEARSLSCMHIDCTISALQDQHARLMYGCNAPYVSVQAGPMSSCY